VWEEEEDEKKTARDTGTTKADQSGFQEGGVVRTSKSKESKGGGEGQDGEEKKKGETEGGKGGGCRNHPVVVSCGIALMTMKIEGERGGEGGG